MRLGSSLVWAEHCFHSCLQVSEFFTSHQPAGPLGKVATFMPPTDVTASCKTCIRLLLDSNYFLFRPLTVSNCDEKVHGCRCTKVGSTSHAKRVSKYIFPLGTITVAGPSSPADAAVGQETYVCFVHSFWITSIFLAQSI